MHARGIRRTLAFFVPLPGARSPVFDARLALDVARVHLPVDVVVGARLRVELEPQRLIAGATELDHVMAG
jgi:hypothetical protein